MDSIMLATTALIMPITPAAVTVGVPHWTVGVNRHRLKALNLPVSICRRESQSGGQKPFDTLTGIGDFEPWSHREDALTRICARVETVLVLLRRENIRHSKNET